MYAVSKTGGKQYRVSPGDVMVVEKLAGEPGDNVAFGEVLMVGEGDAVVVGAPTVAGASVSATLVETRKGEKVKIFKKIRRQGYRRTRGHRQTETALRVIGITGADDQTTKGELDARARGLTYVSPAAQAEAYAASKIQTPRKGAGTAKAAPVKKAAAPKTEAKAEAKAEAAAPKETKATEA